MQSCLPDHLSPVLAIALRRGAVRGGDIADALEVNLSTAHRHLASLVRAGFLERHADRKDVWYTPRAHTRATFVGPLGTARARATPVWGRLDMDVEDVVDWRFPLVYRVPDGKARGVLLRLLVSARDRGILTPWLTVSEPEWAEVLGGLTATDQARALEWLRRPDTYDGHTFVVYGSCARGDARADSDLDILVIGPAPETWQEGAQRLGLQIPFRDQRQELVALVQDMNLAAARHIDLRYVERSGFFDDLSTDLQNAITRDGITVYASDRPEFIEAIRWKDG